MRVLLLNFERGWRGGERQTLLTAIGLKEQGLAVTVLARQGGVLAERLAQQGISTVLYGSALPALVYLIRHRRAYDVFHAQTSAALTWLSTLRFLLKGKVVFTRRTAFPLRRSQQTQAHYEKRLKKLRWKWSKVDEFVAISEAAAADPRELGFSPHIIPSAVEFVAADTDHIIEFTDQYHLSGRYVLGTVAALSHEKDPLTTIRAIHLLWQQRQDFVFLHFGADGDAAAEARALVKELGLEQVYVFVGFESRIEDMYRLLHVFILSSKFEALGSSVLDAFLYAAPAIVTNAGGLPELVADERGVLCEVGDFEAIAQACSTILDDEAYRSAMILNALRWVQKEHGVEQMVARYVELYQNQLPPESVRTEPTLADKAENAVTD